MAQTAGHIAQPCRRGRSLRTVCGDSDPCAVFQLNHLEPTFFPHTCAETPNRAETPTRAETPNRVETRILTVFLQTRRIWIWKFSPRPLLISNSIRRQNGKCIRQRHMRALADDSVACAVPTRYRTSPPLLTAALLSCPG